MTDPGLDELALRAALRFDEAALDGVLRQGSTPLALGWRLDRDTVDSLQSAEQRAREEGQAGQVVHAAALRALHLSLDSSQLGEAVDVARRASRMARTEATPEMEYLAHLILARLRRLSGRPYLATRILGALSRYAPSRWKRWIAWELCMAGGLSAAEPQWDGPAALLRRGLAHAQGGDREAWDQCVRALRDESWPLVSSDVARITAVIDPEAASTDEAVIQWCRGAIDLPPAGLLGVAGGQDVGSVACIIVDAERAPRRILRVGAKLAQTEDSVELEPTHRRSARVDTMLAVLALANRSSDGEPSSVELATLFREVWGFKFVESTHSEALEVTLHRARERLGEHGRIERSAGSLRLLANRRLLVPDPRCTSDLDERVLQHVARHGSVSARDAARALGISLRAVQKALKDLVEGGACERRRDSRAIVYGVEDTTFREPTAF